MDYLLTFLEGLASFISPCMLPMIPLYLSYFAGEDSIDEQEPQAASAVEKTEYPAETTIQTVPEKIGTSENEKKSEETKNAVVSERTDVNKKSSKKKHRAVVRSLFFVIGFSLMFVVFGGLVGLISGYINKYKTVINIVAGAIVVIFGLSYIGLFGLPFFKGLKKSYEIDGAWSAFLFGIVFAVGVGPCTGAFLGSALALASTSGTVAKGLLLLLFYSMGIGIPFIITAVLTDKTKKLFGCIKRHFKAVKIVSGSLLVVMGILMAAGIMDKLGALFS
ncbi:MAG: cytochrome c biogenesis protein CcdA [Candidatus Borkfalkiaceae bacterium]|nr:cytochrome c biogenesis protein CcdA [Christensenellaceae bacterium]